MISSNDKAIRVDLQLIADMIEPGSRVLDVGCGDGALLDYLVTFKRVDGRGIELSSDGVNACVSAGLPVIQGNANSDLFDYPDKAFDYVVLSQTLQAMDAPRVMLEQLLRIGRRAIVSLPNFANWRLRWYLIVFGRMPVSDNLPHQWYETPNIHLCSIRDFVFLCRELGVTIERSVALDRYSRPLRFSQNLALANLFGDQAVFMLSA
jgi:methionine biosynthesis protein MetW